MESVDPAQRLVWHDVRSRARCASSQIALDVPSKRNRALRMMVAVRFDPVNILYSPTNALLRKVAIVGPSGWILISTCSSSATNQ
jgi:hypothetical protein